MQDERKTKRQLVDELNHLHRQIIEFDKSGFESTLKKVKFDILKRLFEQVEWGAVIRSPDGKRLEFMNPAFAAVLREALENLKTIIEESGARVTHDPLPRVTGDSGQLRQLLQNLISNAIKFRGEETPSIHISAEQQGKDWVLSVRDNGIGIAAEQSERIFDLLYRFHKQEYPGTGIGLAVCKKIVEQQGGAYLGAVGTWHGLDILLLCPCRRREGLKIS